MFIGLIEVCKELYLYKDIKILEAIPPPLLWYQTLSFINLQPPFNSWWYRYQYLKNIFIFRIIFFIFIHLWYKIDNNVNSLKCIRHINMQVSQTQILICILYLMLFYKSLNIQGKFCRPLQGLKFKGIIRL